MIILYNLNKILFICFFTFFSSNLFSQTDSLTADSLLGYWKFDTGSGSIAFDSSGNENDGQITGADWTAGYNNNALIFEDSGDVVEIPSSSSLALMDSQITIACWVRVIDRVSEWTTIIQRSAQRDSNNWFDFQIYAKAKDTPSGSSPVFRIDFNENGHNDPGESIHLDTTLAEGQWYYLTCTYDGTNLNFYLDGVLERSVEHPGNVIPNSGNNILVGTNETWPREFFFGTIDELRLYGRALTAEEITDIMQDTSIVDVAEDELITPEKFQLYQNFPNPFNPSTTIKYSLSDPAFVTLKVFNLLGKEVATLVNENQNTGVYTVEFDASNLSNGVYFYKLSTPGYSETKKLILLK